MAEKKKILYIVEAMGGGVFTYIVDLANELVNKYDMYIAYAVRKQTPKNYKDYIALKRTKQVGYSSVAGAIINAAINVLLIRIIGLYAASISTAVSFFVIAIYRAIDLNKIIEIKYNKKEIEIGMGLFLISTICLNCNQVWTIVLCWGIAGIYNITQNMQIAKRIIGKFLKK